MTDQVQNKATTRQQTVVECPKCKFEINTAWYVNLVLSERVKAKGKEPTFEQTCRGCDAAFKFHVTTPTDITYEEIKPSKISGLMLVKHHTEELYMVVEQTFYEDRRTGEFNLDLEYFIDEHTCPTNWFKVLMVAENGDVDPHGVFRWVRSVTFNEVKEKFGYERDFLRGEGDDPNAQEEALVKIFPEIELGTAISEDEQERTTAIAEAVEQGKL